VTTLKRRDRGRKTNELKTFEYDKTNRRWVYHPAGRLTKKLDGTGANVDDVISAMMSQNHGRLASNGAVWHIGNAEVSVPAVRAADAALHLWEATETAATSRRWYKANY
jgi:hypothetical protein